MKVNEKSIKERIEKEFLTEKEKILREARVRITPHIYDPLFRFFDFLKHNTGETNQSRCYLTEQSILQKLNKYFGHKTTLLDERFYHLLANGEKNKRIYFDQFIDNFYIPLFESAPLLKAQFMFRMLDFDGDGYLHASDLVQAQGFLEEESDFGQEIKKLTTYYIQTYLKSRGKMREYDRINIHRYKDLLDSTGENDAKPSSLAAI